MPVRYPGTFAAGVPICGGADEKTAAAIAKIPVWVFHGANDTAVKVSRSRNMVAALRGGWVAQVHRVSQHWPRQLDRRLPRARPLAVAL